MPLKETLKRDIIASRVKYARTCAGLTQADVSAALGVTPQQVSNYERGLTGVPAETLDKMAELYNTSVSFLIGDNGNMPITKELSDLIGDAANHLNAAEGQAAIELKGLFDDFLKYVATEHTAFLPEAANCLEASLLCFTHICDLGATARQKIKYDAVADAALSREYLREIDKMTGSYACLALKQAPTSKEEE